MKYLLGGGGHLMDWKLGALWSTISIHLGHVFITMKIVKENESTSNNTESVFETSSYIKVSGSETLEFGRFIWEQTWRMNFTYITVWNDSIALEITILFLENFLPENFTFILLPLICSICFIWLRQFGRFL